MQRFHDVLICFRDVKLDDMGIEGDFFYLNGLVDLDCICHIYKSDLADDLICLCNEPGDVVFVIKSDYVKFKKEFINFKTKLDWRN